MSLGPLRVKLIENHTKKKLIKLLGLKKGNK